MELLSVIANAVSRVRHESINGRDYIVAPLTLIVPGVLPGSKGPLYYPPDEVARNYRSWNGTPLVVYHPTDPLSNIAIPASTPGVLDRVGVGIVQGAHIDNGGKLRAEGWFDVANTGRVDRRVLTSLERGASIELSTGLFTDNEIAPVGAADPLRGRPYTHIARNYRPDHVAILPDQLGACSINDGCGVLVNRDGLIIHGSPDQPRDASGRWTAGDRSVADELKDSFPHPRMTGQTSAERQADNLAMYHTWAATAIHKAAHGDLERPPAIPPAGAPLKKLQQAFDTAAAGLTSLHAKLERLTSHDARTVAASHPAGLDVLSKAHQTVEDHLAEMHRTTSTLVDRLHEEYSKSGMGVGERTELTPGNVKQARMIDTGAMHPSLTPIARKLADLLPRSDVLATGGKRVVFPDKATRPILQRLLSLGVSTEKVTDKAYEIWRSSKAPEQAPVSDVPEYLKGHTVHLDSDKSLDDADRYKRVSKNFYMRMKAGSSVPKFVHRDEVPNLIGVRGPSLNALSDPEVVELYSWIDSDRSSVLANHEVIRARSNRPAHVILPDLPTLAQAPRSDGGLVLNSAALGIEALKLGAGFVERIYYPAAVFNDTSSGGGGGGKSYFGTCERDDKGHCLPSGESGADREPKVSAGDKAGTAEGKAHEDTHRVSATKAQSDQKSGKNLGVVDRYLSADSKPATTAVGKALEKLAEGAHHVEHVAAEYVRDKVGGALGKLPDKVQTALGYAWAAMRVGIKAAFITWTAKQSLAEKVALRKGATTEQAAKIRSTLSSLDMKTLEVAKGAWGASFIPGLGHVMHFGHYAHVFGKTAATLPLATTAYLAGNGLRHPIKTALAAKDLVFSTATYKAMGKAIADPFKEAHAASRARKETAAKERDARISRAGSGIRRIARLSGPESISRNIYLDYLRDIVDNAEEENTRKPGSGGGDEQVVSDLFDAYADHDYSGWYMALLHTGLDGGLDLLTAIKAADEAYDTDPDGPDDGEGDDTDDMDGARDLLGDWIDDVEPEEGKTPSDSGADDPTSNALMGNPNAPVDVIAPDYSGPKLPPRSALIGPQESEEEDTSPQKASVGGGGKKKKMSTNGLARIRRIVAEAVANAIPGARLSTGDPKTLFKVDQAKVQQPGGRSGPVPNPGADLSEPAAGPQSRSPGAVMGKPPGMVKEIGGGGYQEEEDAPAPHPKPPGSAGSGDGPSMTPYGVSHPGPSITHYGMAPSPPGEGLSGGSPSPRPPAAPRILPADAFSVGGLSTHAHHCKSCGEEIDGDYDYCPSCGEPVDNANPALFGGQARHEETGQYQSHGSGTGKGPAHKAAREGYDDTGVDDADTDDDGDDDDHKSLGELTDNSLTINAFGETIYLLTNAELGFNAQFRTDAERRDAFVTMADSSYGGGFKSDDQRKAFFGVVVGGGGGDSGSGGGGGGRGVGMVSTRGWTPESHTGRVGAQTAEDIHGIDLADPGRESRGAQSHTGRAGPEDLSGKQKAAPADSAKQTEAADKSAAAVKATTAAKKAGGGYTRGGVDRKSGAHRKAWAAHLDAAAAHEQAGNADLAEHHLKAGREHLAIAKDRESRATANNTMTGNDFDSDAQRRAFFGVVVGGGSASKEANAASEKANAGRSPKLHEEAATKHRDAAKAHESAGRKDKAREHEKSVRGHEQEADSYYATNEFDSDAQRRAFFGVVVGGGSASKEANAASERANAGRSPRLHEEAASKHRDAAKVHEAAGRKDKAREHEKSARGHEEEADSHYSTNSLTGNKIDPEMAHMASKHAASASLMTEHPEAIDHAMGAMGYSSAGDRSGSASGHVKAAKAHEQAGVDAYAEDDQSAAEDHHNAAAMHRKAASLQAVTANRGGQPMTRSDRSAVIDYVANCSCSRARASRRDLAAMSDAELLARTRLALNTEDTVGSGSKTVQVGGEEDDDDADDWSDGRVKVKKTKGPGMSANMNTSDWLRSAPPEVRSVVQNAMQFEAQQKSQIIEGLIANVYDPDARTRLGQRLQAMNLNALRDFALLHPPVPTMHSVDMGTLAPVPSYLGAAGAGYTGNSSSIVDDVLPLPTMNWKSNEF